MKAIRWLATRLALDGNTLQRRTDKVAACGLAGLVATFLVGAPVATIAVAHWSYRVTMTQQRDQESWRQVPAELVLAEVAWVVLYRRRLADWEADWAATGPRWTRQFRTHGL